MNKITSGLMSSNTDNWATPNNLFEVLDKEFNFNLDPCADTKWFSYCMKASEIRFIEGRVKFGNSKTCAPFPSCIVIWGTPRNPIIKSMRY